MKRSLSQRVGALFSPPPTVSVLRLAGVIASGGRFGRGLEDAALASLIERAAAPRRLAAIALAINSPGGSPAQSLLIADRIRDAAKKADVPVIAFCEDVAASGGYWLACAADEIYATPVSIVGSIGVISASFGFQEAIARVGIERRLFTAGANKSRLDPFAPLKDEDRAWLESLQSDLHATFIEQVKNARRGKLDNAPPEVFSGEVYLGPKALELGLIDGIGRIGPVLREKFGDEVRLAPVRARRGLLASLRGGVAAAPALEAGALDGLAAEAVEAAATQAETRALWARYGL